MLQHVILYLSLTFTGSGGRRWTTVVSSVSERKVRAVGCMC